MSLVSISPGFFSTRPINITYLFLKILLVFWQRIALEQRSLQLLDDQMSVTATLGWAITVAGSFLLLMAM